MSSFGQDRTGPHRLASPQSVQCACGQALRKSDCKALTFIHLERQIPSYNISRETFLLRCTQRYIPTPPFYPSCPFHGGGEEIQAVTIGMALENLGGATGSSGLSLARKTNRRGLFLPLSYLPA